MFPSNRRQCNTLDHRACPEGRAVTRQYAVPAIGSLFNIAQSPKPAFAFFEAICFSIKRTARLSPAVQVREETPWEGQRQRGVGKLSRSLSCKSKGLAH